MACHLLATRLPSPTPPAALTRADNPRVSLVAAAASALDRIDPLDPPSVVQARVAVAAAVKALHVEKEMAAAVLQLLDPSLGRTIDRRA